MATINFGSSAPSTVNIELDSVFGTSLANYRKTLVDNIGATNAFLFEMIKSDQYESCDGGAYIQEPLMYELAPMSWYDGYDELSTLPTDGITDAIYEWRQAASPITYNMKEVIQNKHKIVDLVKSRIMQAEMGIQEGWSQAFWWGAGNGSLATPQVNLANGASGIDPIGKMISTTPTGSLVVGNINQSTSAWWQNKASSFAGVTNFTTYLAALDNLYNSCALGTGGAPNLVVMDQKSYELLVAALFFKFRQTTEAPQNYPFECFKWKKAVVVMEDKVPDALNGTISATTAGTVYMMNTKFFRVRYHPDRNWDLLRDENGKAFVKPINGDSRNGQIGWMGCVTINNRRKQGVGYGIPRTLLAA